MKRSFKIFLCAAVAVFAVNSLVGHESGGNLDVFYFILCKIEEIESNAFWVNLTCFKIETVGICCLRRKF